MKIKVSVSIGRTGKEAIIEIPDCDIEGRDQDYIDELCNQYYQEWASDFIDGGWEIEK